MTSAPVHFESLIELYHDEIYGYLWRLLDSATGSDAVEAEDLTQEVFLRAYQSFQRLRPNSNYRAWLYKIATNRAYTVLKQNRRRAQRSMPLLDDGDLADSGPSPYQQAALDETLAAVRQAIDDLPDKQHMAILLRHIQGLDYAEVAQALGCSEDSARANVYQAMRRLRQELGQQVYEEPDRQLAQAQG